MEFPINSAAKLENCEPMDVDKEDNREESDELKIEERIKSKKVVNNLDGYDEIRKMQQMRNVKQKVLSITKPSYVLGLGNPKVRADNRSKLYTVLRKLVRQQNWKEVSGVLSLVLRATINDKCPRNNRSKYLALMELVKQYKKDRAGEIKKVFSLWMKSFKEATGYAYNESIALQVEFILYLVTIGERDLAEIAANDLLHMRNYDSNPLSHLVAGLTYYQLWYSTLPEEMRLMKTDNLGTIDDYDHSGAEFDNLMRFSVGHSVAANNESENQHHYDSDTSVMGGKKILRESSGSQCEGRSANDAHISEREMVSQPSKKPQTFFVDSENSSSEDGEAGDCPIEDPASVFFSHGLDPWLFPLKLPPEKDYKEFKRFKRLSDHKDYKRAEENLRLALHQTPPVFAALVPLVQLLLLGDQVGKALVELEKFSCESGPALAFRLKASILEHFDHSNYAAQSSCYECLLKKDPTCSLSLGKLISLHREGEYDPNSLIEMIALHLDATNGELYSWKEFAICFFELSRIEEDRLSVRQTGNDHELAQMVSIRIPKIFKDPKSAKTWIFRSKWWLNRHFGAKIRHEDITSGDSELLTYKAACASHMYGRDFDYVQNAFSLLEENAETELLQFLQSHMQHSIGFYSNVYKKSRR